MTTPEEMDRIDKELKQEVGGPGVQANEPIEKDPIAIELAKEALAASEKAAAEEAPAESDEQQSEEQAGTEAEAEEQGQGQDPKISAAFGKQRRDYEAQIAESNRKLDVAIQQLNTQRPAAQSAVAPAKSPEEIWIDENPESLDEPFPAKVTIAQRKFDRAQTVQSQQVESVQTQNVAAMDSVRNGLVTITDETHGAGLLTLKSLGEHLLTENDYQLMRQAGKDAGEITHSILMRRIKQGGGALAAVLQEKLNSSGVKPKPKPKTKTGGDKPSEQETVNQQNSEGEPELSAHVDDIVHSLGIR